MVGLNLSRVRSKSEQEVGTDRCKRANRSWAGTETYKRAGTETCRTGPRCESRQADYGTVLKGGTKVQVVLILYMTCRICYNKKMLRSSVRLCCRLGIMRGCDVWIDTGRDLRGIAGSIRINVVGWVSQGFTGKCF